MKKLLITLVMMLAMGGISLAQKVSTVDFDGLLVQKFPCKLEYNLSDGTPSVFYTPKDLSMYCSSMAQADIKQAQGCFVAGTILNIAGATLCTIGYFSRYNSTELTIAGVAGLALGSVCEIASVSNLLGHWKWEYRRKQVDLYLTPGGAAMKF